MARSAPNAVSERDSTWPAAARCGRRARRAEVRSHASTADAIIDTDIPGRLDALPFGRFHLLVIVALGIQMIYKGFTGGL